MGKPGPDDISDQKPEIEKNEEKNEDLESTKENVEVHEGQSDEKLK